MIFHSLTQCNRFLIPTPKFASLIWSKASVRFVFHYNRRAYVLYRAIIPHIDTNQLNFDFDTKLERPDSAEDRQNTLTPITSAPSQIYMQIKRDY